ncbi:hypothetical protein AB0878_36110 [Amycolatopsis sp. NPDC047767]|uniref:hypothetical protein n=1 Tax=Amycolatopsis sp. NPDC047767 TaxID=3156765 RepID=UPI00345281AD
MRRDATTISRHGSARRRLPAAAAKAQNPLNKRETLLAPTAKGRQVVDRADGERRQVLDQLDQDARAAAVWAPARFADAASALTIAAEDK